MRGRVRNAVSGREGNCWSDDDEDAASWDNCKGMGRGGEVQRQADQQTRLKLAGRAESELEN